MESDVSALEKECAKQVFDKLRSFLLSDFVSILKKHGQQPSVLSNFQAAVSDTGLLTTFLLKLLPCQEESEDEGRMKKKSLREHAKVFDLPLGLRLSLVNQCLDLVSGWHSWSVIEGGFQAATPMSNNPGISLLKLTPTAVVLGSCIAPSSQVLGEHYKKLATFEVFSSTWSSRPLTLLVYDPSNSLVKRHHDDEEDVSSGVGVMNLESFLRLSVQWLRCTEASLSDRDAPCRVSRAYFLRYIKQHWCLIIAPSDNQVPRSLTSTTSLDRPNERPIETMTMTLETFLTQGLLQNSRLLTLDLLLEVFTGVEEWYTKGDLFGTSEEEQHSCHDALRISLRHFLVTYVPGVALGGTCTGRDSSGCAPLLPALVKCELHPVPASSGSGVDIVPSDAMQSQTHVQPLTDVSLLPPELFRPPSLSTEASVISMAPSARRVTSGITTGGSTQSFSDLDGEAHTDSMEVDTSDHWVGMSMERLSTTSSLQQSPVSTPSSLASPTSQSTATTIPAAGYLADLYSLALVVCSILKGRPFSPQEVMEYRKAHEHYYSERQRQRCEEGNDCDGYNIPSYYNPNVEHLVQSTMLQSPLWPEALRDLPCHSSLRVFMSAQLQSDCALADTYLTTLLEAVAILKKCLRFQPARRQDGDTRNVSLLKEIVSDLRRIILLQDEPNSCDTTGCECRSDGGRSSMGMSTSDSVDVKSGTMTLSALPPNSNYLISLATLQHFAPISYASIVASALSLNDLDSRVTALSSSFQKVVIHQEDASVVSVNALWNFLLVNWLSGLMRPVQVIEMLACHQERQLHLSQPEPKHTYTALYGKVLRMCRGDVEVTRLFESGTDCLKDVSRWSSDQVCMGLSSVEALAIKSLALFVTTQRNAACPLEGHATTFDVCIESRISSHSSSFKYSETELSAGVFMESKCLPKSTHFSSAICCVNSSATAPSASELKAVWLKLDSESNCIGVMDCEHSVLLSVGEVLEIPRDGFVAGPNAVHALGPVRSAADIGSYANSSSVVSLFVDKLLWCTTLQGGRYGVSTSAVPSAVPTGRITATTQPMALLLRGRWLYDDECNHHSHHSNINEHESDIETVNFEDFEQEGYGHDSDSEFSDARTSPAPLYMPCFLLVLDMVTTVITQEGVDDELVKCVIIKGVHLLNNMNHDQTPSSMVLISQAQGGVIDDMDRADALLFIGSGGMLGSVTLPHSDTLSNALNSWSISHHNFDKYIKAMSTENTSSLWSSLPCKRGSKKKSSERQVICPHSPDGVVTTVSYCAVPCADSSGFLDSSSGGALVTGDSSGQVCLWAVNFVQGHFEISLLSDSPLQLEAPVDQLHFAPITESDTHPFLIVACTEQRCCLLASNITPPMCNEMFLLDGPRPAKLYIKAVLDTGYFQSSLHSVVHGHSLCPRYIVDFQHEKLLLWRVMRSCDRVSDVVMSTKCISLTHVSVPAFVLDKSIICSDREKCNASDDTDATHAMITEQLCDLVISDDFQAALQHLMHAGGDVFCRIEMLAWRTILADKVPLLSHNMAGNSLMVSMWPLSCNDLDAHVFHIQELIASARSQAIRQERAKLVPQARQKHGRPSTPATTSSIEADHIGRLNVSQSRVLGVQGVSPGQNHCMPSVLQSCTSVESPHADGRDNSSFQPIFQFVSACSSSCKEHCRLKSSDDSSVDYDYLAYVDHFSKTSSASAATEISQRVRVFDRRIRAYVHDISGGDIVSSLLPLLSLTDDDDDDDFENEWVELPSPTTPDIIHREVLSTVALDITAMTFSSSGRYLILAATLTPLPISNLVATRHTNKYTYLRPLGSPTSGVVVWCCASNRIVGSLMHASAVHDHISSDEKSMGICDDVVDASTGDNNAEGSISTPPRPKEVVASKPFSGDSVGGGRQHQQIDINHLELSHQDTLLTASSWREETPRLYAMHWPTISENKTADRSSKLGEGASNALLGESKGKRFLISSSEYFGSLLRPASVYCTELPQCRAVGLPPGRRMAALLLHSSLAWITTDVATKVFALQASQGSGKSDHLCQLVSSLKGALSANKGGARENIFITCVLPTPATIITAFTDLDRNVLHDSAGGSSESSGLTVTRASFAEIAYDLVLSICRQLMQTLGSRFTAAVLKGLSTELTIYMKMRKMSGGSSDSTKLADARVNDDQCSGSSSCDHSFAGIGRPYQQRGSHARQFSEAGVFCGGIGSVSSSEISSGPSTASSAFSGECTPPFLFPPFAFASTLHRRSTHQRDRSSSNQGSKASKSETSGTKGGGTTQHDDYMDSEQPPAFLHFTELFCSTCIGIFLSPAETQFLEQPTGIVLIPHFNLLPYLSISRLFQLLISDPLREIDIRSRDVDLNNAILVIDNLDSYDELHQYNQVQAVIDMLVHCTPSWFRLLLSTNNPFTPATRAYLSPPVSAGNTGIGPLAKHFCLRGDGANVGAVGGPMSNMETGYRLDLQSSIVALLRNLMPFSSGLHGSHDPDLSARSHDDSDVTGVGGGNGSGAGRGGGNGVDIAREQYENRLDDMLGVLLHVVDGSYQCFKLLQSLLTATTVASNRPLTLDVLMRSLSMFDFNSAIMEGLFAITPAHECQLVQKILEIVAATFEPPPVKALEDMLVAYASTNAQVHAKLLGLSMFMSIMSSATHSGVPHLSFQPVTPRSSMKQKFLRLQLSGLSSTKADEDTRATNPFGVNVLRGHSLITTLYLMHSSNKSIAVDHTWQAYLKTYGPSHLHRSSRLLSVLTKSIRKIDETSGMKGPVPVQLGYISGLQEIYARRVGIYGSLPSSIGCLDQLRVLSMGNNKISGSIPKTLGDLHHLQRIVLHQNRLSGVVPKVLSRLGCIVNLAGNPLLIHGDDVPHIEKYALQQLFRETGGSNWVSNVGWAEGTAPVSQWYKVGVLGSNVHSIVMSSNNMVGQLPDSIAHLQMLRMVELATMPGLRGRLPVALCQLVNLRRLCICRCGLVGDIPSEISHLIHLEELQLFGNNLSGLIPSSLGDLTNLRLLSLGEYTGGNNFIAAPLPSCISRLRKLEALFMANCHLHGPLPNWIGNLTELRQLDLQRNSISGTIPAGFQHLKSLLYLNLKDNHHLSGPFPVFPVGKLTKLNRLSLVHCGFDSTPAQVAELQRLLPRCRLWI